MLIFILLFLKYFYEVSSISTTSKKNYLIFLEFSLNPIINISWIFLYFHLLVGTISTICKWLLHIIIYILILEKNNLVRKMFMLDLIYIACNHLTIYMPIPIPRTNGIEYAHKHLTTYWLLLICENG